MFDLLLTVNSIFSICFQKAVIKIIFLSAQNLDISFESGLRYWERILAISDLCEKLCHQYKVYLHFYGYDEESLMIAEFIEANDLKKLVELSKRVNDCAVIAKLGNHIW